MADRVLSGYRVVPIQHGDTLRDIAARELSDASRWSDIADINGLLPPYLTGDSSLASETVKLYGQSLIVPASSIVASAVTDANRVFGVDIMLTAGQLTAANGDFDLVGGQPNLKQALINRVVTDLRELIFHLPYGCDIRRVVGSVSGPAAGLLAARYVKSAILLDPRIDKVLSCSATINGDVITVLAKVQPVTGVAVDFSVEI
jgi:hypothetical protein